MSINRDKFEISFRLVRSQVLLRDGNRCVKCGLTLDLEVHHIEGYKENDLDKLVTLCCFCHGIAPMGRVLFEQWLLLGDDGVEVIRRRLVRHGLRNIKRDQIVIFCATLSELKFGTTKEKMKKGRECVRSINGKCEGRHAFGYNAGEREILERMMALDAEGKNLKEIADEFNLNNVPTRMGGKWKSNVICKILAREKRKETA